MYYRNKVVFEMWFEACIQTQYTCGRLTVPNVVRENMRPGLLGQYRGGDTIYVRRGLMGLRLKEVLMHEMVHYIQSKIGGLEVPGYAKEICAAEAEAFATVDQWLIEIGADYLVVGPDWWKPYTHCWKWYDPKWDSYSLIDKMIWSLDPDGEI